MIATKFLSCFGSSLLLAGVAATAAGTTSYVYSMTNSKSGNSILQYQRAADGTLSLLQTVPTGGKGGGGTPGSQGSLLRQGHYLFAVNLGSNTITVLNAETLAVRSTVSSGGSSPISLTFNKGFLYVLNDAGVNNITGFTVNPANGSLTPLPGSTQLLSAANVGPAEVAFNPQGTALIVTEKNTSLIDVFPVTNGVAGPPTVYNSAGITPYGFATSGHNWFFVSEAETGLGLNQGTVSSYQLSSMGVPAVVTGALALSATAPCWVVVNAAETYAYVANNGSNSISQLSIDPATGVLTLVKSFGTGPNSGPADLAISPDGKNLYSVDTKNGSIGAFTINSDGSLTKITGGAGTTARAGLAVH